MAAFPGMQGDVFWADPEAPLPDWRKADGAERTGKPKTTQRTPMVAGPEDDDDGGDDDEPSLVEAVGVEEMLGFDPDELFKEDAAG